MFTSEKLRYTYPMMRKGWIRLKILSVIKSLSGNIVINYLLPNSVKYRLAKNFVFPVFYLYL